MAPRRKQKTAQGPKRLYRSSEKVLGGVCGGIANYLDADPTAIRVLWAVLTVFTAFLPGILAYFVCWMLMAEQP